MRNNGLVLFGALSCLLSGMMVSACSSSDAELLGEPEVDAATDGASDSASGDSSAADSGTKDSSTSDSAKTDSGTVDSGTSDSTVADSGTVDSTPGDASTPDSSLSDSGAQDSSVADSSTGDSSAADSAVKDAAAEGGDASLTQQYGIDTNLGSPVDSDGNPLPSDFNPLGSKISRIYSYKQISTSGVVNSNNGQGKFNFVLDDSTSNTFSTVSYSEYSNPPAPPGTWTNWPHASVAADLDGTARQAEVSVVFYPNDTTKGIQSNVKTDGYAQLRILSYDGKAYSTKNITIPGSYSLFIGDWPNAHYAMAIAAGDINGDGKEELAVAIGNTLTFLSVDVAGGTATHLISAPIDLRARDATFGFEFHPTTLAAGDLTGDGNAEFVVVDGADRGSAYKAMTWVYGWTGTKIDVLDSEYVANSSANIQQASATIGDIDGDGRNDVIFAGDNDVKGNYTILAANWDTKTKKLKFLEGVPSQGYGGYTWGSNRNVALKAFHYYTKDGSGNVMRNTALYCHDSILTFDKKSGWFTKVATAAASLWSNVDVGDVNRDGSEEVVFPDQEGQERLIVFGRTNGGTWQALNTAPVTYTDNVDNSYYTTMTLVDFRGQSDALEYLDRQLKFSDPQVVAVLASVPYYTTQADNIGNCYTEFGGSQGTSTEQAHSFTVSAGISLGTSVDTPLWGAAGSVEAKTTIEANFNATIASSTEQSVTRLFVDYAGEDHVVFTSIPYDSYRYQILNTSKTGPSYYYVNIPREPQLIVKERSLFNALPNVPVKIDSTVLSHTIGDPTTYPTKKQIQQRFSGSNGMWDSAGHTFQPAGAGLYQIELTQGNSNSTSLGGGFSITTETEIVAAGALFGAQLGFSYDFSYTVSTTNDTIVGAAMPYLPAKAPVSLTYNSGIAAYTTGLTGQKGKAWIVNFWVN